MRDINEVASIIQSRQRNKIKQSDNYSKLRKQSKAVDDFLSENSPPPAMDIVNKNLILCRVDGTWEEFTPKTVARYYAMECNNGSGYRSLGSVGGDWRMIDAIASDLLSVFKQINMDGLRIEARKYRFKFDN